MAALNRFISRLGEKGLPFFKLLRASGKFEWIEEAHEAFEKLKTYLTSPLVLSPSVKDEPLLLYITATTHVVSTTIVVEKPEEVQSIKYSIRCTILVKYSQSPKYVILRFRNYSMLC
jgi:hypothetical protein